MLTGSISYSAARSARDEVGRYIDGLLSKYQKRVVKVGEDVKWHYAPQVLLSYRKAEDAILVDELIPIAWIKNSVITMKFLDWAIAHEFWHHYQDERSEQLFSIPVTDFTWISEFMARIHAKRLSGTSHSQGLQLTSKILDLIGKS